MSDVVSEKMFQSVIAVLNYNIPEYYRLCSRNMFEWC